MKNLQGSEKQIAWAEKIRQGFIENFENKFSGNFESFQKLASLKSEKMELGFQKAQEIKEKALNLFVNIESASEWIQIGGFSADEVYSRISKQEIMLLSWLAI